MRDKKIKDIIIVVLALLCVSLVGFIIYDRSKEYNRNNNDALIKDDENIITDGEQDSDSSENEILLEGNIFGDLLNDEQKKLVDLDKSFDDVTFTINNTPITYSCADYHSDYPSRCTKAIVSFQNHILTIDNKSLGCGTSYNIIYTNNYLILQTISACTETGKINIYDNNDKLLLDIANVTSNYKKINDKIINNSMELVDNKLYYFSYDETKYVDSYPEIAYYSYVDLGDDNYNIYNLEEIER